MANSAEVEMGESSAVRLERGDCAVGKPGEPVKRETEGKEDNERERERETERERESRRARARVRESQTSRHRE